MTFKKKIYITDVPTLFLRVGSFCLPLLFVLQIGVSTVANAQALSNDQIIKTYFLPSSVSCTADIEKSFQVQGYNNIAAIHWLKTIKNSTEEEDLAKALPKIKNDLSLPTIVPPPLAQVYVNAEQKIQGSLSNTTIDIEVKKFEVAYSCAYFVHSVYLFQAKNGVLILNPQYGTALYRSFAEEKIPEEFQEKVSNTVESPKTVFEKIKKYFPFAPYGLVATSLLVLSLLFGRWRPKNNTGEIQAVPKSTSQEQIKASVPVQDNHYLPEDTSKTDDFPVTMGKDDDMVVPKRPKKADQPQRLVVKPEFPLPVPEPVGKTEEIVEKRLYARIPNGSLFYQVEEVLIPFLTHFELTLNSFNKNEATFTFVENESSMLDLIQTNPRLFDEICEVPPGKAIATPADVQVIQPGKAVKNGEYWEIKQKIVLR